MRGQTKEYVSKFLETHTVAKVLEVGSLDVNGAINDLFTREQYLGTDMRDGRNVDMVINGHNLTDKFTEEFDLVMCFDTFEHDDAFWITLEQMKKVLKPGGYILLGFPGRNCPEHDHPHDYWRFMPQSAELLLQGYEDVSSESQTDDPNHKYEDEVYCMGRKPL